MAEADIARAETEKEATPGNSWEEASKGVLPGVGGMGGNVRQIPAGTHTPFPPLGSLAFSHALEQPAPSPTQNHPISDVALPRAPPEPPLQKDACCGEARTAVLGAGGQILLALLSCVARGTWREGSDTGPLPPTATLWGCVGGPVAPQGHAGKPSKTWEVLLGRATQANQLTMDRNEDELQQPLPSDQAARGSRLGLRGGELCFRRLDNPPPTSAGPRQMLCELLSRVSATGLHLTRLETSTNLQPSWHAAAGGEGVAQKENETGEGGSLQTPPPRGGVQAAVCRPPAGAPLQGEA